MPSDRKPRLVVMPAIVVALVALGTYFGAYYWRVQPHRFQPFGDPGGGRIPSEVIAIYVSDDESDFEWADRMQRRLDAFFAPANWIDRRIRLEVWAAEEPELLEEFRALTEPLKTP